MRQQGRCGAVQVWTGVAAFVYLWERGLAGLALREGNPLNATNFWIARLVEGREGGRWGGGWMWRRDEGVGEWEGEGECVRGSKRTLVIFLNHFYITGKSNLFITGTFSVSSFLYIFKISVRVLLFLCFYIYARVDYFTDNCAILLSFTGFFSFLSQSDFATVRLLTLISFSFFIPSSQVFTCHPHEAG